MDAVEFYKQFARYCSSSYCCECPIVESCKTKGKDGRDADKIVRTIEQWAKDNPIKIKTRKSEFLKMFPNADMQRINTLFPCVMNQTIKPARCAKYERFSSPRKCVECRNDYWNEEVSE